MIYALSFRNRDYFKDRINLVVALGPMSRPDHTKSTLLKLIDDQYDWIRWTANLFTICEVFGAPNLFVNKVMCGVAPSLCK